MGSPIYLSALRYYITLSAVLYLRLLLRVSTVGLPGSVSFAVAFFWLVLLVRTCALSVTLVLWLDPRWLRASSAAPSPAAAVLFPFCCVPFGSCRLLFAVCRWAATQQLPGSRGSVGPLGNHNAIIITAADRPRYNCPKNQRCLFDFYHLCSTTSVFQLLSLLVFYRLPLLCGGWPGCIRGASSAAGLLLRAQFRSSAIDQQDRPLVAPTLDFRIGTTNTSWNNQHCWNNHNRHLTTNTRTHSRQAPHYQTHRRPAHRCLRKHCRSKDEYC